MVLPTSRTLSITYIINAFQLNLCVLHNRHHPAEHTDVRSGRPPWNYNRSSWQTLQIIFALYRSVSKSWTITALSNSKLQIGYVHYIFDSTQNRLGKNALEKEVCLFGVFHSTREFFTHMETSSLPVKGCKFWPLLGTHGHKAVTVL